MDLCTSGGCCHEGRESGEAGVSFPKSILGLGAEGMLSSASRRSAERRCMASKLSGWVGSRSDREVSLSAVSSLSAAGSSTLSLRDGKGRRQVLWLAPLACAMWIATKSPVGVRKSRCWEPKRWRLSAATAGYSCCGGKVCVTLMEGGSGGAGGAS